MGWKGWLTVAAGIAAIVSAVAGVIAVLPDDTDDTAATSTTGSTDSPSTSSAEGDDGPSTTSSPPTGQGAWVAFSSRGAGSSQAFVVDVDALPARVVWEGREATGPSTTPHGQVVAAVVVDEDGRRVIAVGAPDDEPRLFTVPGTPSDTAIAPDGRSVAYVTDAGGDDDIAVLDVGSGEPTIVAGSSADETDPSWSADGTRLVHVRAGSVDDEIVALPWGGSAPGASLTATGRARSPWATSDGSSLAYVAEVAGSRDAVIRSLDGGAVENASGSPEAETGVVLLADGRLVTSAPDRGLLLIDPTGRAEPVQLTTTAGDLV